MWTKQSFMSVLSLFVSALVVVSGVIPGTVNAQSDGFQQALVEQTINKVAILSDFEDGDPTVEKATEGDFISEDQAIRTHNESRAGVRMDDGTIARLGQNSFISFTEGEREVQMGEGASLIQVPKQSQETQVRTATATASLTGTTVMFEEQPGNYTKTIALEGSVEVSKSDRIGETRTLESGQMLVVPDGAERLPDPVEINLQELYQTSGLTSGMASDEEFKKQVEKGIQQQQAQFNRGELENTGIAVDGEGMDLTLDPDAAGLDFNTNSREDQIQASSSSTGTTGEPGGPKLNGTSGTLYTDDSADAAEVFLNNPDDLDRKALTESDGFAWQEFVMGSSDLMPSGVFRFDDLTLQGIPSLSVDFSEETNSDQAPAPLVDGGFTLDGTDDLSLGSTQRNFSRNLVLSSSNDITGNNENGDVNYDPDNLRGLSLIGNAINENKKIDSKFFKSLDNFFIYRRNTNGPSTGGAKASAAGHRIANYTPPAPDNWIQFTRGPINFTKNGGANFDVDSEFQSPGTPLDDQVSSAFDSDLYYARSLTDNIVFYNHNTKILDNDRSIFKADQGQIRLVNGADKGSVIRSEGGIQLQAQDQILVEGVENNDRGSGIYALGGEINATVSNGDFILDGANNSWGGGVVGAQNISVEAEKINMKNSSDLATLAQNPDALVKLVATSEMNLVDPSLGGASNTEEQVVPDKGRLRLVVKNSGTLSIEGEDGAAGADALVKANEVRARALGANGKITIDGTILAADDVMKLYALGKGSGTSIIEFVDKNSVLEGSGEKIIAAEQVDVKSGVTVTVRGGDLTVYYDTKNINGSINPDGATVDQVNDVDNAPTFNE